MPRSFRSNTKLSAEEIRLQRVTEDLKRREVELQQTLRRLPAQVEARRTQERRRAQLRAEMTPPAISLNGARGSRGVKSKPKHRPLPVRERQNAQIKFVVLCLIFAIFALLLWRAIP